MWILDFIFVVVNQYLMMTRWCKIVLLMCCAVVAIDADAQMKRIVACHSSPHTAPRYMEVYECDYVDEQPQFPGGEVEMIKYINSVRRYPADAYHQNIQGRVLCSFVVNADGSLSHISVIRGVEPSLNREAVRLISRMPRWVAGKVANQAVPVHYILPIVFRR